MKKESIHYIYIWSVEKYGVIYVGQGQKTTYSPYRRAFSEHKRQKFLQSGISKIDSEINVTIISDNLTKAEADEKERYIIHFLGRVIKNDGKLYNISDGGSEKSKVNKKPIFVNGKWFESIQECADFYEISHGKVCHCLRDGRDISSESNKTKKIIYNGIEYVGYKELAEKFNLPIHVIANRLEKNIPLDLELRNKKRIVYNGIEYFGYKELSKKFNLKIPTIKNRLKSGIPLEEKVIEKIKVEIDGIIYNSLSEASKITNKTIKFITYWIEKGKFKTYE